MSKPLSLSHGDWNKMVGSFHTESDRGAAVLAGGYVEHALGSFLRALAAQPTVVDELFAPMGPLSSFSQRTAVAFAFGFITKSHYDDLTAIRRIRNHFAHHPLDATFETDKVALAVATLSTINLCDRSKSLTEREHNRIAYLLACGLFSGWAYQSILARQKSPSDVLASPNPENA
jgi:hypothetical protein